jgi:hypothetical protein
LEQLLKEVILPKNDFQIAPLSGIMGMGNSKNPIVSQLSENVYCGVRLEWGCNRKFSGTN